MRCHIPDLLNGLWSSSNNDSAVRVETQCRVRNILTIQDRLPRLSRHWRLWPLLADLRVDHEAYRAGEDWILLRRDQLSLHHVQPFGAATWWYHCRSDDMAVDFLYEVSTECAL